MELSTARQRLRDRLEDESVTDAKLDTYLNDASQELGRSFDWPWLLREFQLPLRTSETLDDATLTQDSRVVTLSTAADSTPFGHTLLIDGRVLRCTNVESSATKIHIEYPWPDASGTHDITVLCDELALPRGVRKIRQVLLYDGSASPVEICYEQGGDLRFNDISSTGRPILFGFYRRDRLPAPVTGPSAVDSGAGSGPDGVHLYWQTYWDPKTGGESRLSPSDGVTVSDNTVNITPDTRQDLGVRHYRSKAGGSTPHFLGEQTSPTAVFNDSFADEYLGAPTTLEGAQPYLRFWPPPDKVYQVGVRAVVLPPEFQDDTDPLPVPEEDVPTLLLGAESIALRAVKEWAAASDTRAQFLRAIADMRGRHAVNRTGPIQLGKRSPRRRPIVLTTAS